MKTNERIEELKKYFHTTDERGAFSVQELTHLIASVSKVPIERYHWIWKGTMHEQGRQV